MDTIREGAAAALETGQQIQEKVGEAAGRAKAAGAAMWERAKMGYSAAQDKAVQGARATDRTIRSNPYQAIGIAFGLGLLVGFLIKRRR